MPTATCRVVSPLVFFFRGETWENPQVPTYTVSSSPARESLISVGRTSTCGQRGLCARLPAWSFLYGQDWLPGKTGLPAQQLYGLLALSPEGAEAWGLLLPSLTLGCWAWIPLEPMTLACFLSLPAISLWAQEAQLGIQDQLAFQASVSCQAPVSCPCELAWACMVH